jgi:hypothetical protein
MNLADVVVLGVVLGPAVAGVEHHAEVAFLPSRGFQIEDEILDL